MLKRFAEYSTRWILMAWAAVAVIMPSAQAANPIAILDSSRTSTYFGLAYQYCNLNTADPNAMGSLEYKRYWGGWEQVLKEMKDAGKIPGYDVVNDQFIANNLISSSYRVLILSNNVSLSTAMTDAVRSWVSNGGRLMATFGTGYGAFAGTVEEALGSKTTKNTLQQLWGDPLTKIVTTGTFGTVSPATGGYPGGSVEPIVTRDEGPNASICQYFDPAMGTCPWYYQQSRIVSGYGDLANMLVGRSDNHPGNYAMFAFANNLSLYDPNDSWPNTQYAKPLPAIIYNVFKKGKVVYYPFAPDFITGLEYDTAGHCPTDPNYPGEDPAPGLQQPLNWANNHWAGRTPMLRAMMKSSVDFLLNSR
jgi:hypothetical protein